VYFYTGADSNFFWRLILRVLKLDVNVQINSSKQVQNFTELPNVLVAVYTVFSKAAWELEPAELMPHELKIAFRMLPEKLEETNLN
jgi:hypothetical protein